jgi:hypothetical protein
MTPSGETPTSDDFASRSSTTLPLATAQCNPSTAGAATEVVGVLPNIFCTGLDLSKDNRSTLLGVSYSLLGADGISVLFSFSQTANTCALGRNASYAQMVTSCKSDIFISQLPIAKSTKKINRRVQQSLYLRGGEFTGQLRYIRHVHIIFYSRYVHNGCPTAAHPNTISSSAANLAVLRYKWVGKAQRYRCKRAEGLGDDGCMTTATQKSMKQPLGPGTPTVNCVSLLTEDFENCKC